MIRFFSEGRDCVRLQLAALCGWLILAGYPGGSGHLHHGGGHLPLIHGLAMALVMLYPLSLEPVRHVRRSSFPSTQAPQMAAFVLVYLALWTAFGMSAASVPSSLGRIGFPMALGLAWLWQSSAVRRAAAGHCHATWAVYGDGFAGLSSSALYGLRIGVSCLLTCGPLMLAAMLSPQPLIGMIAAFLLIVRERFGTEAAIRENAALLGAGTILASIIAGLG